MRKKALVGAAIVIATFSCASVPANRFTTQKALDEPIVRMIGRDKTQTSISSNSNCIIQQGYLVYNTEGEKKKVRLELGSDEAKFGFACTERRVVLLTNKAMYIYPGTREMEALEPKDVEYVYLGFKKLDGGALSQEGDVFVIWKGDSVEAHRLTPIGMDVLFSYGIKTPVKGVGIDHSTKRIFIDTQEGERFYFDFSGKEIE
ncbi:MAG: hypothetical protein PHU63_02660 [Candidatus ainarchaeum sp.]|nr:hypothetical protein [Candidatus ainarchaeum sp.]